MWLVWDKLPEQERNILIGKYDGAIYKNFITCSPEEIGLQHGKLLSEQIHRNIEFYEPITLSYLSDEAQVLQSAERIKEHIKAYNPNYITEIDHLALPAVIGVKMCFEGNAGPGLITADSLEPPLFFEGVAERGIPLKTEEKIISQTTF